MAELRDSILNITGIGEKRAKLLSALGITTVKDLILYFPRAYEDRSSFRSINSLTLGESACIRVLIADEPRLSHIRRGLDIVKFRVFDQSGSLTVTYFNQSYIKNSFVRGKEYIFYGKIGGTLLKPELTNPVFEDVNSPKGTVGRIVPLYRLSNGISQKLLSQSIHAALSTCIDQIPDILPPHIRQKYALAGIKFSLENIHFPKDANSLSMARRRLIFEELFVLSCALGMFRGKHKTHRGNIPLQNNLNEFFKHLPFQLTAAQKRCVNEAISDMLSGSAMNRLLQGDVGSGKTVVAAACIWYMFQSNYQSAFMVPTEILANQHFETLTKLLSPFGIKIDLLTGHLGAKQKRDVLLRIESGQTDLVIGTHALLSKDVHFKNLSLVVTDEQHRFGVVQRAALGDKGNSPHILVMSATPIPRTLALMIYGDLDVSIIDELPPGRLPIETYAVREDMRQRVMAFIRKQVAAGQQVFIICPLIEEIESASSELKAAQSYAEFLQKNVFPQLRVSLIHGRMKAAEKEAVMLEFATGKSDVLVATTIVEVGIDVPNASLIVIENAERFGLSQLHQLRGRVGRGLYRSYCILMQGSNAGNSSERLAVMCHTQSGFKVAEEDLRLRGPGDFFGSRQHGLPEMHIANLSYDIELLRDAQSAAQAMLQIDPSLKSDETRALRARIDKLFSYNMNSLN